MKYKVGDTVTIKSQEWYDKAPRHVLDNQTCYFVPQMKSFLGKTTKITHVKDNKVYELEGNSWNWIDDFLENKPLNILATEGEY